MKRNIFFLLVLALGLMACNEKTTGFKVNVSLANGNEKTVYLQKFVDNAPVTIDSAVIVNETASLSAPLDDPQILYAPKMKGMRGSMPFFADNKDVAFVGDFNNLKAVEIMASESQAELDAYDSQIQEYYSQMKSYDAAKELAYQDEDYARLDSLVGITNGIKEEMDNFTNTYFKEHADRFLTHYILNREKHDYPVNQLKEISNNYFFNIF